jgi:endonuclease YncB( thermonuclease family)
LSSLVLAVGLAVGGVILLKPDGRLLEGRIHVVDGDSLRMGGTDIRLKGIDAPELRQTCRRSGRPYPCGQESRQALLRLVGDGPVRCRVTGRDRYGRSLARCTMGEADLGAVLVQEGHALAYGGYVREEASARKRSAGLWSGEFERPDAWRRRQRS